MNIGRPKREFEQPFEEPQIERSVPQEPSKKDLPAPEPVLVP